MKITLLTFSILLCFSISAQSYKSISKTGDTLYLDDSKWLIVPGISTLDLIKECYDGKLSDGEKAIDCGGICPRCAAKVNPIQYNLSLNYGCVTDIDCNDYNTIKIGSQEWMVENLRTSRFQNGDDIPNVVDDIEWKQQHTPAFAWYDHDENYDMIYGKLYNWFAAVDERNICPSDWHVPSDDEWAILVNYLEEELAGFKTREVGLKHWVRPNIGATNESGFTGLPGGIHGVTGYFSLINYYGVWWTTTVNGDEEVRTRWLSSIKPKLRSDLLNWGSGLSIRCIKD